MSAATLLVKLLRSCVDVFTTWTAAHQDPSAHGISEARKLQAAISFRDYNPGTDLVSPALAGAFFATEPPGEPKR